MSGAFETANGSPSAPKVQAEDYQWIKCKGCGGEVGIPQEWSENRVECPQCEVAIQVKGRVLYRPCNGQSVNNSTTSTVVAQARTPSLDLIRKSDKVMICGILSIVLGWTVLVPLFGICEYGDVSKMAKKEQVLIPGKAIAGLVLALLFGVVQALPLIVHLLSK